MQSRIKEILNNSFVQIIGIFLLCVFIIFMRRPDMIFNPQFWAEDGKYWFGEAYEYGPLRTLFYTYAGSLQVTMRLIGSVSLFMPFTLVPALFTWAAIIVQILPVLLIHSRRFGKLFKNKWLLWGITFGYLLMPNSIETHANLTNIGWHLALVSFLILIAPKAVSLPWKSFDVIFLFFGSVTGPFSLILAIPAFLIYIRQKYSYQLVNLAIVGFGALAQIIVLAFGGASDRSTSLASIGAEVPLFVKIVGKRIFGVVFLGNTYSMQPMSKYLIILFFIVGVGLILYTLYKSGFYLRLFVGFCWLVFFATLASPAMGGSWLVQLQSVNDRYWFLPSLSFIVCLVYMICKKSAPTIARWFATVCLLIILSIGITSSFRYKPLKDMKFNDFAKKFNSAESGETLCTRVNPDDGWTTCIVKK